MSSTNLTISPIEYIALDLERFKYLSNAFSKEWNEYLRLKETFNDLNHKHLVIRYSNVQGCR
ncbi:MAG: hypothetical protein JWP44_1851 [Mucilaginibacter sp.]|nr:hypothetical protein [Mucilaginibacter sp.]